MTLSTWLANDELFLRELREGHAWQMLPATFFTLAGLRVEVPALRERERQSQARQWSDTTDIVLNGWPIEVKSRREAFTSNIDYPYKTAFVDTVSGFEAKTTKPLAYVLVSRPTGAMLCLSVAKTRAVWKVVEKRDRVRDIDERFYVVGSRHLQPVGVLVDALKAT